MTITNPVFHRKFFSELRLPPCHKDNRTDLTLRIKVGFAFLDGPAKPLRGEPFDTIPWTPGTQTHFSARFKQVVEKAWSNKFYIEFPDQSDPQQALPALDYAQFVNPKSKDGKQPYVTCHLAIDVVTEHPHLALMVYRIAPFQGRFGAFTWPEKPDQIGVIQMGDRAVRSEFTRARHDWHLYRQIAAAHEVGHFLGNEHVNASDPQCLAGSPNAPICYGADPYERRDMMGDGHRVGVGLAGYWLQAMRLHTGNPNWAAVNKRPR